MKSRIHAGWIAVVVFAFGGCDQYPDAPTVSTSTEEADVTGLVKLRGKPVDNGRIVFHSANIRRATQDRSAKIGADGSYTIKAYLGQNVVRVDTKELMSPKNRMFQDFEQQVDVQSGPNSIDIEINPDNKDLPRLKGAHRR